MYRNVSNIPSDMYINNTLGDIQIVIPEETTNLITNPSVELDTTGYTSVNATLTRVCTEQHRGIFSLQCVPSAIGLSGLYYGTITLIAGQLYTFSVDVKAYNGVEINIYFADTSGNLLGTKCKLSASEEWQRAWVTYGEISTTTRRVYVVQNAKTPFTNLYVDGLQVENKGYRTTYCDGDLNGYVVDDEEYLWNEAPHASTSTRLGSTASGGKIVNLIDYVDGIISITGSGMIPVNISLVSSNPDGYESYLDSITSTRKLLISCEVSYDKFSNLSILFHSSRTLVQQPILLRVDKNGGKNYEQDIYLLKTIYKSGLEGDIGNGYWEDITLEFESVEPVIYKDGDHAEQVTIPAFSIPNYVVKLTKDMEWQLLGTGATNGLNNNVYAICESPDGVMYFGGDFTQDGAGNSIKGLCYWNETYSQFVQCDVGVSVGIRSMAFGVDGNLYFGGTFTTNGSGGALLRVGIYNPITNTIIQIGNGLNNTVHTVGISPAGVVYFGGAFTADGIGGTMNYVAYWNGVSLVNAGTGLTSTVKDIEWNSNGQLVVGGLTYLLGTSVLGQSAVAYWNGTQYVKMGDSLKGTELDNTYSLGRLQDGSIIAISTQIVSPDKYYIFQWDGDNWNAIGDRFHNYKLGSGGAELITGYSCSNSYAATNQSKVVVTVNADYVSDKPASNMQFYWDGTEWQSLPYCGNMLSYSIFVDGFNNTYFGSYGLPTNFNIAGRITIDYKGTYPVNPEIIFYGESRPYSIINITTNDKIYFRSYLIQSGNYIKIVTDNNAITTITDRNNKNLTGIISDGSDFGNLKLLRGDNIITALATKYNSGTSNYDAVDTIYLKWREGYWSLV